MIEIVCVAAQQSAGEDDLPVGTSGERSKGIPLCCIARHQLMHIIAAAAIKPVGEMAADKFHGCYAPDPLPIGLPEQAV